MPQSQALFIANEIARGSIKKIFGKWYKKRRADEWIEVIDSASLEFLDILSASKFQPTPEETMEKTKAFHEMTVDELLSELQIWQTIAFGPKGPDTPSNDARKAASGICDAIEAWMCRRKKSN